MKFSGYRLPFTVYRLPFTAYLLFPLFICPALLYSLPVKIGIYNTTSLYAVFITPLSEGVFIIDDNKDTIRLDKNVEIKLEKTGDSIRFSRLTVRLGYGRHIIFAGKDTSASFHVKVNAGTKIRTYKGRIIARMLLQEMRMLNETDLETYVGGVIKSEVGTDNPYEFKKLKAIICRTYALSSLRKHSPEGFELCDGTHCQVFAGITTNPKIMSAVLETAGQVLVDDSINLINTSFFSNCGGQTMNSEDVWSKPLPYLSSVIDTFCLRKPSAVWTKKIEKKKWLNYFSTKFNYPCADTSFSKCLFDFDQPQRKKYFIEDGFCIQLRTIREDWTLRSTFFSVEEEGDFVILKGRGFGHGVGLCQEGAMEMAKRGYTVKEIIDFYYQDVLLIDLSRKDFFKESGSPE
jgi:stage II sporulation protein D